MSHRFPDEADLGPRIAAAGYQWGGLGENIAAINSSADQALAYLMSDEEHRGNILNCGLKDVGIGAVRGEELEVCGPGEHPAVEVVRGPAGCDCVVRGVDEVRPDLEGLNDQSAPAQRADQPKREGGLAHTAVCASDDDRVHGFLFLAKRSPV